MRQRSDPGRRQNTEKPDKPLSVTTSSDVPEFATEHLKDTLKRRGSS